MDQKRKHVLLQLLKEGDDKEIPFIETKKRLIDMGYSEAEISHSLFEVPYDGKKNPSKKIDPTTELFEANPELTHTIGKEILKDAQSRKRNESIATGLASKYAPGPHAKLKYSLDFFDELGMPFFTIISIAAAIGIFTVIYELPALFIELYGVIISIWVAVAFYRRHIR